MWGRIYPNAVLLIFMDIILKISCQGNGSITFLIDDTSSMDNDIKQVRKSVHRIKDIVLHEKSSLIDNMVLVTFNDPVRKSVHRIKDIVLHEKSSLIDNMVLVTFNDPGVLERVVTKDPKDFKNALDAIKVHNEAKRPYLDCWEPAMKGLLLALKKSKNNSYIFVFTDAPAKDYIDSQSVIEMCQQKQTQIIFVLTGTLCSKYNYHPDAIKSYYDIATACSGLAFSVQKNEVDKVFGPIEEIIKGNKTVITTATIPAGVSKSIPFTIDGYTDYVIIYSSGTNVSLKINQRSVSSKEIMGTDNVKVLKLTNIEPGSYSVTVKGSSRTTIVIVGRTNFFFNQGFSESKPKSLSDTSPQPMSDDTKVYLAISVTNDEHSVKIVSAQFLDMDEKPILQKMPLSKISTNFYVTDQFIAPSQRFKVAVNGIVAATGQPITRISKIPIAPPPPKVAPKVQGVTTIKANKGETVQIECKVVKGFPAPTITWLFENKSNSTFTPIPEVSDTVLVIKNVEGKDDGKYKCNAENVKGKDELVTTLHVRDPPKIVSSVSTVYESTEGDASLKIPCGATGLPKPSITWKLNEQVINQNSKYSIEDGALIIRDPTLSDQKSYKCEAKNELGVVSAIFKTYIRQKPKVSGIAAKQVRLGLSTSIECTITKGEPKPTITWYFMDNTGLKFLKIDGSERVQHISSAENKHAGSYKCVAENKVGTDEHITTLEVQDKPTIVSTVTIDYQSTEGDALLKIPCATTGVPKPSITWKLNDNVINPSTKYSIEDGTLIIRDPMLNDTNFYTCEAKNELGAVSAPFKTYIRQKPQVSGVRAMQVKVGASASIECTIVKGEPKPAITWHFMDYSNGKFEPISGSDKVLHISKVEHKHAGRYKCVAQNSVGSDEHNTTLEVQEAPQVTGVATKKVGIGSPTSIECTVVKGIPKPTITWQFMDAFSTKFGSIAGSDKKLQISSVESKHAGRYKCVAQNSVGSDEHITTLVVQDLPKIVSNVSTIYQSTEGDALMRIPCTATGLPKPSITWELDGRIINPSTKYSIEDGTLIIRDPMLNDTNFYTCEAKNELGAVSAPFKTYIRQKPQVSGVRAMQVKVRASASIECTIVKGEPKPTITWHFMDYSNGKFEPISGSDKVLHISKVEHKHAGRYKCVAQNSVGSDEHNTTLEVQEAPQVTGVATKKVGIGSPTSIECTVVKGIPKPTITWQFMDAFSTKFGSIAGSDKKLQISSVESKHAGRYKCVAQNSVGSDEHITTLVVQDLPKIVSNVSTIYQSTEGDALMRIPCTATGLPKPSITWELDGRIINPSTKYSIEDGTLIIRDPMLNDTNFYTCEAKNELGAVSAPFKTYIRQKPQVSGVRAMQVKVGASASIECTIVKGEPKPTITWHFMDYSNGKFEPISGSDKVLHISKVEHKHAGRYKCVAQNSVGSDEHNTTLEVQDLPKIVSNVSTIYQSTEGDALMRIPCTATGLPKPSITWKLDGRIINPSEKYSIDAGTLVIREPKVSDTNSYTCEANNEVGTVTETFKTYIRQVPIITGVPINKVEIGSAAIIMCTVKGEPKPTITWQFMDNSSSKFLSIPGSDEVLSISKVESKHAGRYKCIAQNNVGSNEHVTTLEVQVLPKVISSNSTTFQSTEGDDLLRIPCGAVGVPVPDITWKLDGIVIKPSQKYSIEDGTLIIRDPKVSDTNSYTCEAKNEVGTDSATFKVYIQQSPKVKGVASKNVKIDNPVDIECLIDQGEPTPNITWQFMDKNALKFITIAGSENILHISNAENKHAGRYKCVAQNIIGSDEHVTKLIVEYLPGITINSTTIEGVLGDLALRIPCNVIGVPQPVITWKKNGNTITPNEKYSIEDGALVIMKPEASDSSSYMCEAVNSMGSTGATFQTTVRRYPKSFGTEHYVNLKEGTTKKLECEAYTSKSQSIKWFKTKNYWLLSTKPSQPDSVETTTPFSSKAFSLTSRTNELNNNEPYIQITSASPSDHNGNYTCHVSDKHGNTQTHTYVVDVGNAPKFISEDNSLSNWRGDITDIMQYCDIESNAKPMPTTQWSFNGKVLTDLNSAGVGYYTCNVSNVHGYVLKRFDVKSSACLINRNLHIAPFTPLVLNNEGFWNKLETTKYYTIVEQKMKITLSCPSRKDSSNSFKIFPKKGTLEAICYKGDSFIVDDKTYKFSDLQCNNTFQPSVITKKTKCSTDTSELIRVGYNVPGFLEAYEVCFDHKSNMPSYTRIVMTETNNNGASGGYNWYTYAGETERGFTCKDASSSCCYSKSQLVNAIDFNDGPAKKSTFIDPLNLIPVWRPCDTSKASWEDINDMVRTQLTIYTDIVVWSGTHTMQEKNGAVIPRYLWKVVRLDDDEVMAIVHVNDPNPTKSDIKCKTPDTCDKYEDWFKSDDSNYCCSLPDFLKSFDIHGTDIGEILDAALDKMAKKP